MLLGHFPMRASRQPPAIDQPKLHLCALRLLVRATGAPRLRTGSLFPKQSRRVGAVAASMLAVTQHRIVCAPTHATQLSVADGAAAQVLLTSPEVMDSSLQRVRLELVDFDRRRVLRAPKP